MSNADALLVMVHGSPRPIANQDMYAVVGMVKARGMFSIVKVGFMECNLPTIPEAIAECVAEGARSIVAVPYFLHVGTHVADDLPGLLEEARAAYPQVAFYLGRYIGESPILTEIMAKRVVKVSANRLGAAPAADSTSF